MSRSVHVTLLGVLLASASGACSDSDSAPERPLAMAGAPAAGVAASSGSSAPPPAGMFAPSAGAAGALTSPPSPGGSAGSRPAESGGAGAPSTGRAGAAGSTIMGQAGRAGAAAGSSAAGSAAMPPAGACRPKFGSGLNVAWFTFAGDIPNPNIARFTQLFHDTHDAGGRIVRFWLHTNGTVTPGYDDSGMAKQIPDQHIADLRKLLDAAHAAGVAMVISLWSFDMLQGGQNAPLANNEALLTRDQNRQAYIDRVLTPMVAAVKGHPGLYAWEIFNEPEGMTTQHGWTAMNGGRAVDRGVIQVCVNWFADAIRKADPGVLVTNGAWQFAVNANVDGHVNLYSDDALRKAGGRDKGTLDFYQVHYYDNWNGSQVVSPFTHPQSYWNVDKPIAIGEFWAIDTNGVSADQLYVTLHHGGYAGAWAWQYASDDNHGSTKWPAMRVPMQKLYDAERAAIECESVP